MFHQLLTLLRDSFALFNAQRASRLAAALAFYALISLSPLLVVAVGAADLIFDDAEARQQLTAVAEEQLPDSIAVTVVPIIEGAGESQSGGLAAVFGLVAVLLGASNVFNQLQDILNRLWGIEKRKKPFWQTVRERALAFAMVFGFGILLVLTLIGQTILTAVAKALPDTFLQLNWLPLAGFLAGLLLTTLLFAIIFRILPDAAIPWRDALVGGLATALLCFGQVSGGLAGM